MPKTTKHILISGKVQGVGFRNFTQQLAKLDNLQGWVRNLKDGRVEALVQGTAEELEAFVKQLRSGPNSSAKVSEIEVESIEIEEELKKFNVTPDGDETWPKILPEE